MWYYSTDNNLSLTRLCGLSVVADTAAELDFFPPCFLCPFFFLGVLAAKHQKFYLFVCLEDVRILQG